MQISISQNSVAGPRRGTDAHRYWFSKFPLFPNPFPNVATVIRTRHCRLRRSCVEGSSGSVGFKAANRNEKPTCLEPMKCSTRIDSFTWYTWLHDGIILCYPMCIFYQVLHHVIPTSAFVCPVAIRTSSKT